ncbi:MAG: hypothetical protein OIF32_02605 [Campylobacterales bacterium]|nr:hypothetical protein [Campylobacterales bacterium]
MKKEIFYSEELLIPRPLALLILFLAIFFISLTILDVQLKDLTKYIISALFLTGGVFFIIERYLRKKFVIKLEFREYYFLFKKYKFQYVDIRGFEFKNNKITLYMKHYKPPIKFNFLSEDDANRVAIILKQKHI